MYTSVFIAATCCLVVAQASHQSSELQGVPNFASFSQVSYPQQGLQELGSTSHGELPVQVVKVTKTVAIKVPVPYPVKVPHTVPYPVPVNQPYPVAVPKIVNIPQPVPVEVIKKVPVPVEVPKPYPVPSQDVHAPSSGYGGFGGGYGSGFQPSYGVPSYGGQGWAQSQNQDWAASSQNNDWAGSQGLSNSYGAPVGGNDAQLQSSYGASSLEQNHADASSNLVQQYGGQEGQGGLEAQESGYASVGDSYQVKDAQESAKVETVQPAAGAYDNSAYGQMQH